MTVQELIDELIKVKDKSKTLYSAEYDDEDDFPVNAEIKEVKKYVKIYVKYGTQDRRNEATGAYV